MKEVPKKLKPVIFAKGYYNDYYRQNTLQQGILLKAMMASDNPNDWRKMLGVKTMAQVYRTLDKIIIRKEYHQALGRQGITFDAIIKGIKDISNDAAPAVRLKAYQTLLRSLGVERYDDVSESSKDWEELIINASDDSSPQSIDGQKFEVEEYVVEQPVVPEGEKEKSDRDKEAGRQLYE